MKIEFIESINQSINQRPVTMNSTYGLSTPPTSISSGYEGRENHTTQSKKELARDQVEILGTPPHYNETREDAGNDTSRSFPSRQAEDDELTTRQREEEESLILARALMAEEAVASYAAHMDYLRHNQDQFSEEDLAALQAAMEIEDEVDTNGDTEESIGHDTSNMSYETMLQLGEHLGDVKSERWARVAQQKIDTLPIFQFDPEKIDKINANDCDTKCLICQEEYCKKENLRQLPCRHCFHHNCVDQWLLSKDFCPYCRTSLEKE